MDIRKNKLLKVGHNLKDVWPEQIMKAYATISGGEVATLNFPTSVGGNYWCRPLYLSTQSGN